MPTLKAKSGYCEYVYRFYTMLENKLLQIYLDEYHGEEAWYHLLAVIDISPNDYPDSVSEIKAIMTRNVPDVEKWMDTKIGAFDGMSANQVINLGEEGITAVKAAIMRFP